MTTVKLGHACRLAGNMADTHHTRRLDEISAQMTVSSGYKDETATEEDIRSDCEIAATEDAT